MVHAVDLAAPKNWANGLVRGETVHGVTIG
jgi:hypothetical protein